jgi:hypothetical protein
MNIAFNLNVTPGSFDPISLIKNLEVEAIDVIEHTAEALASDVEVRLCSAIGAEEVHFVLIVAESYPMNGVIPRLSYKIDANTNQSVTLPMFALHSKHMDEGYGAAGLIFDSLFISNSHPTQDVNLTIYVGRDA